MMSLEDLKRKMPNFFVIGVVKGGTTSLYDYLNQHEGIYLSPIKETNHFAQLDIQKEQFTREYALDVKLDFEAYFKRGMKEKIHIAHVDAWDDYQRLFSKVNTERVIGEVSNSYMVCPSAAKQMHEKFPDAKLIVMLRNPIKRVWSQYLMNLREGKTAEKDFLTELKNDLEKTHKGWGVSHLYHELGCYYQQLQNFLSFYPAEQLKVLVFEDFKVERSAVMEEVFSFLNLDAPPQADYSGEKNTAALPRNKAVNDVLVKTGVMRMGKKLLGRKLRSSLKHVVYSSKNLPELPENAQRYLKTYYEQEVLQLDELLGLNLYQKWGFHDEA